MIIASHVCAPAHLTACMPVYVVLLFAYDIERLVVVAAARATVTESDKIATLMRSQFHAYCFSLSEDRKAITIIILRSPLKRQKICGFFSLSHHAPASPDLRRHIRHHQPKSQK